MGGYINVAFAILLLVLAEIGLRCLCANLNFSCIERERKALLEVKASVEDPYNTLSSWKGTRCCQWAGIDCDNITGHVVKLYLDDISAPNVNASLLELKYLTYLDLSFNDFKGTSIPMFIGSLRHLEYLSLSYSNFSGRIPNSLGNLKNLKTLDLSHNHNLQMNDTSWISRLHSLEYLNLTSVDLSGVHNLFQVLNMFPSLLSLYLSNCRLDNSFIPHYALQNMSSLLKLDLSSNNFTGPIPFAFINMTSIESIHLNNNSFTSVPQWFYNFEKLSHLDLSHNHLDFVPSLFGTLNKLVDLDLSHNFLFGPIPEAFRNMTAIESLDLGHNNFTSIPSWFAELRNLVHLDIQMNELSIVKGSLSSIIGNMCHLERLYLGGNKLQGESMGHFELSGCIGYKLEQLDLRDNDISGHLPTWLGQLDNIQNIDFSSNSLYGPIPLSLCQLSKLKNLDLSKNNLSGEIPNCWKDNQGLLEEINLSSNKLVGVFPSSFLNLSSLVWLHLNNNSLQGELPIPSRNLNQLRIMDLGENKFFGSIPSSWTVSIFPSLRILRLRQNMLNGNIPPQLCQLKSLTILDISLNKLEGFIPSCISNLQGMVLGNSSYRDNSGDFSGGSVEYFWSGQNVNEVTKGVEYEYTKIVGFLVNIDMSGNNLVGSIPSEITWLTGLHGLNLSNNQLNGEIPKMIGNITSLESLDMSHNQLSGTVPNSMTDLTSLSKLNLSYNNLSGQIPESTQLSTLNDLSIYAHNPYLCGSSLPYKCHGDVSHPSFESIDDEDDEKDKVEKIWFYFVIALGFGTGFWGVIGTLFFKKKGRHFYFRWAENVADDIYVAVVIKVGKIKKWVMKNHVCG